MLSIRPVGPQDAEVLRTLDTSFETDNIYRVVREELSFRLVEEAVHPPLRKQYSFDPTDPAERERWHYAIIAEVDGQVAGFAAAEYMAWNRRVALWHLYVAPESRRQGVASRLLESVDTFARSVNARCVWLETQNLNYPAIQFYLRSGFGFCGFDDSLYDPAGTAGEEVALYFSRDVLPDVNR